MPLLEREKGKKVTRQDYLTWPDEERWEIINGEAWSMTPAPSIRHQESEVENSRLAVTAPGLVRTGSGKKGPGADRL